MSLQGSLSFYISRYKSFCHISFSNYFEETYSMPLNGFDSHITHFINQFSHKSIAFDEAVVFLSNCQILKGGILMTGLWWVWFKEKNSQSDNKEHIISTLLGSFLAMFIVRILANKLPCCAIPIFNPENHLVSE